MRRHLIIIFFSVVLLVLSIYGLFNEVLGKKEKINKNKEEIKEEIKEFTKDDFDNIVGDYLGLSVLVNKKSLNEMTNQEKLRMIIDSYTNESKYGTISQSKLEEAHKNSIIRNMDIIYEDLYDYYGTFLWNNKSVAYKYDKDNQTLTYTGALGHGGVSYGNICHKEMISLDTDGKTYTVKYRYIFMNTSGDGPSDAKLYLNIEDALNNENEWVYLPVGEDNDTHSDEYISKHYGEVKDKLKVYTYKFEVINGELVIYDFFVQ